MGEDLATSEALALAEELNDRMAIDQWDDLLRVTEGFKQIQELCRHRSITTTFNEYGGLFDSLHERLADRLEEAIQVSRAGRMRDDGWTNVVELGAQASGNVL